jgi:hypothetical protein
MPLAFLVMGSFLEVEARSGRGLWGVLILGMSLVAMDWGIWNHARARGHSSWIASLALLNVYGLLLLHLLPPGRRPDAGKEPPPQGGCAEEAEL